MPGITTTTHTASEIEDYLGFFPAESLVLTCTGRRRTVPTVRINLVDLADEPLRLLGMLAGPLRTARVTAIEATYYTTGPIEDLIPIDCALDAFLADMGIERSSTRLVDLPPQGPSREELGRIPPASQGRREAAQAASGKPPCDGLDTYLRALEYVRLGQEPPAEDLGCIGAWMHASKGHRDAIVVLAAGGTREEASLVATDPRGQGAEAAVMRALDRVMQPTRASRPTQDIVLHTTVLRDVVSACAREYHVSPRSVLAFLAWWEGRGALASRHCEEALAVEPGDSFTHLVVEAMYRGVAPGWVITALQ